MQRMEDVPMPDPMAMEVDGFPSAALEEGWPASLRPPLPSTATALAELTKAQAALAFRELTSAAQWSAELCVALPDVADDALLAVPLDAYAGIGSGRLYSSVVLAKAHFGMREYGRAAHVLQHVRDLHRHPAALFIRLYALYLAGEKRREEEAAEVAEPVEKCQVKNAELEGIEEQLAALHERGALQDGLLLYLYGIVLRGLGRRAEARRVLVQSVHACPWNWSAWLDIVAICSDLNDAASIRVELKLPDHWMAAFFWAALLMELQRNEEAAGIYAELRQCFPDSSYIMSQIATCQYNMRNFDASQVLFDDIRKRDPYKLASLDTFSNILYVKEQSAALSHLARQAVMIDKYTPEACCIVGNYYSLRGEHEKSVTYFRRALSLNRNFTPAWILMGHEYMEMRNTSAAIDAYRTAVSINQRDYRAWYGLGQTYEMLNLHFYALFYYRRSMMLRPDDARMWCAMAECYHSMDRKAEALNCYEKAHRCGDRERVALPRLARLHVELGNRPQAAHSYEHLLAQSNCGPSYPKVSGGGLSTEVVEALKFLMVFYREEGRLSDCENCASQLLDTAGAEKDEAKAMLQDLRVSAEGRQLTPEALTHGGPRRFNAAGLWTADQPNM
mmetsp:Transcript_30547/g.77136  ORF Transcript_30547/g.77136 Transcript_30547/m.77136 type:complete len:618 (-) Transcript_30547:118-1971(-)